MITIKVKNSSEIPKGYTGIVEWDNGLVKDWYKNGNLHKEDGPAIINTVSNEDNKWFLNGKWILMQEEIKSFSNWIVLSKSQHPEYPLVQIWKILDKNGLFEQEMTSDLIKLFNESHE